MIFAINRNGIIQFERMMNMGIIKKKWISIVLFLSLLITTCCIKTEVHASSDEWYTFYYNSSINQTVDSCFVAYKYGTYTATIDTSSGGSMYNEITPRNGTSFSGTSYFLVSNLVPSNSVIVNGKSSNNAAEFTVTLKNYSNSTLIYGTISN